MTDRAAPAHPPPHPASTGDGSAELVRDRAIGLLTALPLALALSIVAPAVGMMWAAVIGLVAFVLVFWFQHNTPSWFLRSLSRLITLRPRELLLISAAPLALAVVVPIGVQIATRADDEPDKGALIESSTGAANVTHGDTDYSAAVAARPGDVVEFQLYVRNMSTRRPLRDLSVSYAPTRLAHGVMGLHTVVRSPGQAPIDYVAVVAVTDSEAPSLARAPGTVVTMRTTNSSGDRVDTTIDGAAAARGRFDLPDLPSGPGRDALTVTLYYQAS